VADVEQPAGRLAVLGLDFPGEDGLAIHRRIPRREAAVGIAPTRLQETADRYGLSFHECVHPRARVSTAREIVPGPGLDARPSSPEGRPCLCGARPRNRAAGGPLWT